jgi:hypothetical protein
MLSSFGIGAVFIGVVLAVEVVGIVSVPVPVVEVVVVLVESVVELFVVLSLHDQSVAAIKMAEKAKKFFFIHECLLLVLQKFLCHY